MVSNFCDGLMVSIVMPVKNVEEFIKDAIDSVLSQSHRNFELLIINDGSLDNTMDIVRSYRDSRIVILECNKGLVSSLNMGISKANSKYVARMDADDIMHPKRLETQIAILESDPSIVVCGSWMTAFGKNIRPSQKMKSISGFVDSPLLLLCKENFMFHPTVVLRKSFLEQNGILYREGYDYAEDLKMWSEIAYNGGTFFIDSQYLMLYRVSAQQVSQRFSKIQRESSDRIFIDNIKALLYKNEDKSLKLLNLFNLCKELESDGYVNSRYIVDMFCKIFLLNRERFDFF